MVVASGPITPERPLWGIGSYPTSTGAAPYRATRHEMARHVDVASRRLQSLGVVRDDIVVFVGRGSEAVQFAPWELAVNGLGATFAVVDGFRSDARRLVAYVDQFRPRAVLGVVEDVATAAAGEAELGELFAGIPSLAVRPGARQVLLEAGLDAALWLHAGPAVAVECRPGAGAHIDPAWQPEIVDGILVVHAAEDQELPAEVRTGVRASLDVAPCECGSEDPRVRLESAPWSD